MTTIQAYGFHKTATLPNVMLHDKAMTGSRGNKKKLFSLLSLLNKMDD
jgi:hypothetical protein